MMGVSLNSNSWEYFDAYLKNMKTWFSIQIDIIIENYMFPTRDDLTIMSIGKFLILKFGESKSFSLNKEVAYRTVMIQ